MPPLSTPHPPKLQHGSKVLDVSQFDGSVDFGAVKRAGIDAVIARAAYIGKGNAQKQDDMFTPQRVKEIRAAGLVMGAYMYSIPRRNARGSDDFHYLLGVAHHVSRGLRGGTDMKLILDLEESDLDGEGNSKWLADAYDAGQAHNRIGVMGYAAIDAIPFSRFVNVPCWVANPGATPGKPHGLPGFARTAALHQYTFTARVPGVGVPADLSWVINPAHMILPHPTQHPHPPPPLYRFPVQGPFTEGRTDRGVDMETVPHCHIYAIGDCEVTAVQDAAVSSLGQIAMRLVHPWHYRGKTWRFPYVFHLPKSQIRVRQGQRCKAGDIIATSAERPPGAENMRGHIEYGFALAADGRIDQNVGPDHYAPSGAAMHALLRHLNPGHIQPQPIRG